jgi:hypothetical protein
MAREARQAKRWSELLEKKSVKPALPAMTVSPMTMICSRPYLRASAK